MSKSQSPNPLWKNPAVLKILVEVILVPLAVVKVSPPAKLVSPVTAKLVEVALVVVKLLIVVLPKLDRPEIYKLVDDTLVAVILTRTEDVAKKLVEVRLVKIPVDGTVLPIGVLSITPPLIVKAFTTIALVIESFGKLTESDTYRLVVEALTNIALVDVITVPETAVKNKGPDNVPPVRSR